MILNSDVRLWSSSPNCSVFFFPKESSLVEQSVSMRCCVFDKCQSKRCFCSFCNHANNKLLTQFLHFILTTNDLSKLRLLGLQTFFADVYLPKMFICLRPNWCRIGKRGQEDILLQLQILFVHSLDVSEQF